MTDAWVVNASPVITLAKAERLDLLRDEAVEFVEIGDEVSRQCEVQGAPPIFFAVAEDEVCKSRPASALSRAAGLRIE